MTSVQLAPEGVQVELEPTRLLHFEHGDQGTAFLRRCFLASFPHSVFFSAFFEVLLRRRESFIQPGTTEPVHLVCFLSFWADRHGCTLAPKLAAGLFPAAAFEPPALCVGELADLAVIRTGIGCKSEIRKVA
ncbi:unnamed protein product [Ostreobium quekettii]|uniref:Uncharacterized protein n=1 Tax=Ostreobium quekettii TaxID=121088 RepID=A0A8S1IPC7_9CHLO|nr:unnamed protein product [Ostreobium quekettii]